VLVIQHQPGLIMWDSLAELLGSACVKRRPVVLVLHSTQRILDIADEDRGVILAALAGVARLVVHTIHDVNRLKALGLVSNVVMIPQGAVTFIEPAATPVVAAERRPMVIGCYGFFFRDKGILQLIEVIARLRHRYGQHRLRLRLVNAEADSMESKEEIARCRAAVEAAGLGEVVEWYTDFLPDEDSRQLLNNCDVIALPYQASKEGSSAALRIAMSAGVPVAVTPLPLFDEAGAAVFRFRSTEISDIADGIAFLLDRPEQRQQIQAEMRLWLADRHWPLIAKRLHGMLQGLRINWQEAEVHRGSPRAAASLPAQAPADTMV
jgi:glycosyltransferase involved in cell wall biosynthesis